MEKMIPYWLYKIYDELLFPNNNNNNDNNGRGDKHRQLEKYFILPPIEKRVCDITVFISQWTDEHKNYNAIYSNCQRFAFDLFEFLTPIQFQSQIQILRKKLQSPYDVGKEKRKAKNQSTKKKKIVNPTFNMIKSQQKFPRMVTRMQVKLKKKMTRTKTTGVRTVMRMRMTKMRMTRMVRRMTKVIITVTVAVMKVTVAAMMMRVVTAILAMR